MARQAEYFSNRLAKNEKALRRWAKKEDIQVLRIYDRDIPEIPLAVDRYGPPAGADPSGTVTDGNVPEALPSLPALHIALYERPYDKDPAEEVRWLDAMATAASERLGIPLDRVFLKTRRRMRGLEQYERGTAPGQFAEPGRGVEMLIREDGLKFAVNLSDYLDTGIFPDHRNARSMIRAWAPGKRVLNLFCYTGAFSVHAAAGGAARVVSVDLSNTYLAWAKRNFDLNGLAGSEWSFVRADAMAFLARAAADRLKWDIIVADPPTFSNSSMAEADFDVNRDWPRLLTACARVLSAEGFILFSTNSRRLKWEPARAGLPSREISEATIPKDFRNSRIHRAWLLGAELPALPSTRTELAAPQD